MQSAFSAFRAGKERLHLYSTSRHVCPITIIILVCKALFKPFLDFLASEQHTLHYCLYSFDFILNQGGRLITVGITSYNVKVKISEEKVRTMAARQDVGIDA